MPEPLLSYAEAAARIALVCDRIRPASQASATETVPLSPAAGRVLAAEIRADRDQPPFPRATRDGFAGRAAEISTHQFLFLAGRVRAGEQASAPIAPGELCEIMTGAPIPAGADCVFMIEHAEFSSEVPPSFVRLAAQRTIAPGENIVPQGAEAHAGAILISPGIRIGPAHIALAAQCGLSRLEVYRRPRVAILATGDELVPIDQIPGPGQIRNSNAPMLAALAAAAGAEPIVLPVAADREQAVDDALAGVLNPALEIALLLISGGISAGRFDLVEDALLRAGARFHFQGVALQPGKPVAFGEVPVGQISGSPAVTIPFLALPGNPISSAVTFQLFAAPLLAALAGDSSPQPRFVLAELKEPWSGRTGLTRFLPALCDFATNPPRVRTIPWQGSGDLAAFARANCLLVVPADAAELSTGSLVRILLSP
jgi:molybdopterin molybdotransferase